MTDYRLVTLIILLGLSAFFSSVETAFFSLSDLKVKSWFKQKKRPRNAQIVSNLKQNSRKLIITILIGNNVVNIGASALATVLATEFFGSSGAGIATGIMTFLILIFGEIIPKSFATVHSEKLALFASPIITGLAFALYPLIYLLDLMTKYALKLAGQENPNQLMTEEELKTLIEVGAKQQVIERREKELIEGILNFNDITAREVMTPRTKVFCLLSNMKLSNALPEIVKKKFTRIPIYQKNIDKIVGIIHAQDILKAISNKKNVTLKTLARKPFFTSENRILSELFKNFQDRQVHMAIVVDEFGGTAGIATLEDLLEEIVGEIMDEKDICPQMIMRIDKKTIVAHGDTEIDEINDFFNVNLPESGRDYLTIGGLLQFYLKKIPKKGNKVSVENLLLIVEEVSEKKVLKVRICKLEQK